MTQVDTQNGAHTSTLPAFLNGGRVFVPVKNVKTERGCIAMTTTHEQRLLAVERMVKNLLWKQVHFEVGNCRDCESPGLYYPGFDYPENDDDGSLDDLCVAHTMFVKEICEYENFIVEGNADDPATGQETGTQ